MIVSLLTPQETATLLATRLKELRLETGLKRSTLASQAGVSESSIKRFETTGQISLQKLLRLAHVLARLEEAVAQWSAITKDAGVDKARIRNIAESFVKIKKTW